MMRPKSALVAPILVSGALLALAACDTGKKPDAAATAAGGDVVEGTISDAMIDLDRSTATAPIVPHKDEKGEAGKDGASKDGADKNEPEAKPNATASADADEKAANPPGQTGEE